MANDLNVETAAWGGTSLYIHPKETVTLAHLNTLVNASGYASRQLEVGLSGVSRVLVASSPEVYQTKLVLGTGTYLFQCSIYANRGGSSPACRGTIRVDGTVILGKDFNSASPELFVGSGTLVVGTAGRYTLAYEGVYKASAYQHFFWVGYREIFQAVM